MERTIGIKVADGTFYPVLEDGFYGDKRLVLTTVRDDQSEVHVDLYQGAADSGIGESKYIGSLIIENIPPGPKGRPDIEVVMGTTREGDLNVSATDKSTGEEQSLSVSLHTVEEESTYDIPDFEVQSAAEPEKPEEPAVTVAARPAAARRPGPASTTSRWRVAAVAFLVVLGLSILGVVGYFVCLALRAPAVAAEKTAPVVAAQPPVKPAEPAPSRAVSQPVSQPAKAPEPASKPADARVLQDAERGVRYNIKWGDTLWDLSSSYYRDPWLYPRIAKANSIKNPDLIFAGTTIFIPER